MFHSKKSLCIAIYRSRNISRICRYVSTCIIFVATPVATALLLHALVHLEHLCSPSGFLSHACEKQPSCCSHCARVGEFPVCRKHSSKQVLHGIIKSVFPNTRWITGTDLQFCLLEGLGCCAFISRLGCICNDVCLCSNRKM